MQMKKCIPQSSPTQCECVTVLSQSCSLLAHVAALPTHTPIFNHLHITALDKFVSPVEKLIIVTDI